MIKMQVIGRLGKDCVVNTVNGKNVINFTVAHSEKFKDSQGNSQEKTTWVDCAYWTDRTAVAPYLTKGTQVYVEGSPEVRSFQRQDGTAGASLSMRVRDVQLLGGRNDNAMGGDSQSSQQSYGGGNNMRQEPSVSAVDDTSDDLPF